MTYDRYGGRNTSGIQESESRIKHQESAIKDRKEHSAKTLRLLPVFFVFLILTPDF